MHATDQYSCTHVIHVPRTAANFNGAAQNLMVYHLMPSRPQGPTALGEVQQIT